MVRRSLAALSLVGLLLPLALVAGPPAAGAKSGSAGRYIVVLDDRAAPNAVAAEHSRRFGAQVGHVYAHALSGYSATLSERALDRVRRDPRVAFVEPDGVVGVTHHRPGHGGGDTGGDTGDGGSDPTACAQTLPWGIDRVEADVSPTAVAGNCTGAVTNVTAYVIDTGVGKHSDLNLVHHVNFVGGRNTDCHGHGTHVAGTVAARDNGSDVVGVIPGAPIVGVKVLGCNGSGSTSGVIAGVDWVKGHAAGKRAVANMSLGGGASTALDNAVIAAANSGVTFAVAAGNSGANACGSSPARAGTTNGVVTTAATDSADREASWSNYGSCVDIWAPGVGVVSTRLGGGTTTKSGTSMASPHVAGAAALWRSTHTGTPSDTEAALKAEQVTTGTASKDARPIVLVQVDAF